MKRQLWAGCLSVVAAVLAPMAAIRSSFFWAAAWVVLSISSWMAARAWNRRDPIPVPSWMWWVLLVLPHGPGSGRHLLALLRPRSGERVLEIGPGPGVHALPVACALAPDGVLVTLDIQLQMLAHLTRRAANAGISNIVPRQADAEAIPYSDHTFDAAYMIATLGEVPDGDKALRELRRVLKSSARLVLGEILPDPDFITLSDLKDRAASAGFALERATGPRWSYLALFRPVFVTGDPPETGS